MEEKGDKNKKYIYISLFVMLAFVACIVFFVNIPIIKKVIDKKDSLELKKMEIEAERADAEQSGKYLEFVGSLEGQKHLLENSIIKKDSLVEFIEEIERIAEAAGPEIEIVHVESQGKKKSAVQKDGLDTNEKGGGAKPKQEVSLKIILSGTYREFLGFYHKLENMPFIFSVDSFSIRKGSLNQSGFLSAETQQKNDTILGEIIISFNLK